MLDAFVGHVRSFVDLTALAPLKVIADTANGMGGLVVPAVFEGLPFSLEVMYGELDGTFPNHPADPIQAENLVDLQAKVLEVGADVGLAFDGDADRVFLVDEQATPVSGSLTTALVATRTLEREPGATIIHNLICSKAVQEVVAESGGTALRTRVGHSFIKAAMASSDAAFGGEHSGHYYFRDNYRADSGLIAALVVLEQMSRSGKPLSELLAPLDRYAASGEINSTVADQNAVIDRVALHFSGAKQDRLDGLTVDHDGWWFNLRPSNTEPLLRLNLEAADRPRATFTSLKYSNSSALDRGDRLVALDPRLLEVLACPEDKGPLWYFSDENMLFNPRLNRVYDITDDIPNMLIEEARTIDDAEAARLTTKAEADGIGPTFEDDR